MQMAKRAPKHPKADDVWNRWPYLHETIDNPDPRICVIVSMAFVENLLGVIIRQRLVDSGTSEKLTDFSGSLGSLQAKCDAAYCLGLISEGCKLAIERLAAIRNKFAHLMDPVAFEDSDVTDACRELLIPKQTGFVPPESIPIRDLAEARKPKARYVVSIWSVANTLLSVSQQGQHLEKMHDIWDDELERAKRREKST
jgi:hypothetical protein